MESPPSPDPRLTFAEVDVVLLTRAFLGELSHGVNVQSLLLCMRVFTSCAVGYSPRAIGCALPPLCRLCATNVPLKRHFFWARGWEEGTSYSSLFAILPAVPLA